MNPLTLVKRIQNINSKEASLGISEDASWHAKYKDSAYVYVGGIPFDLTEGDLLAVFAQYGEIVDVNLVRDKGTGKSKGFAFVAYEDQRSTILAVDNLNGAQVLGRTIRVDHVDKYKKKEEEDEEAEQEKREARGVCRAFQRGNCTYGAGCKFSHNEQRAANTGWGAKDAENSRWENDKYKGPTRGQGPSNRVPDTRIREQDARSSRIEKTATINKRKQIQEMKTREADLKWTRKTRICKGMGINHPDLILKIMIGGYRKSRNMIQDPIEENVKSLREGTVVKNLIKEKIENRIGAVVVENLTLVTTEGRMKTAETNHTNDECEMWITD